MLELKLSSSLNLKIFLQIDPEFSKACLGSITLLMLSDCELFVKSDVYVCVLYMYKYIYMSTMYLLASVCSL